MTIDNNSQVYYQQWGWDEQYTPKNGVAFISLYLPKMYKYKNMKLVLKWIKAYKNKKVSLRELWAYLQMHHQTVWNYIKYLMRDNKIYKDCKWLYFILDDKIEDRGVKMATITETYLKELEGIKKKYKKLLKETANKI